MTPGKGSKYREFYDLSGRITCMVGILALPFRPLYESVILSPFLKGFPFQLSKNVRYRKEVSTACLATDIARNGFIEIQEHTKTPEHTNNQ